LGMVGRWERNEAVRALDKRFGTVRVRGEGGVDMDMEDGMEDGSVSGSESEDGSGTDSDGGDEMDESA
jgi:hypothetical protein